MLDIINKHDIFGIVQTHTDSNSNLQIHDFRHYVKQRENSKGKRNSGGIAVYIRKRLSREPHSQPHVIRIYYGLS